MKTATCRIILPSHNVSSVHEIATNMSSVGEVFHLTLDYTSNLTFSLPWYYIVFLLSLSAIILRALGQAYGTNLRDVPGRWQAKFTRLWLLRAISSRSFQKINLDLHQKYGPSITFPPFYYTVQERMNASLNMTGDRTYRSHCT